MTFGTWGEPCPDASFVSSAPGSASVSNFLMLAICLMAGIALRRTGRTPGESHAALNSLVTHISLPALTLHYLHRFEFHSTQLGAVLMPWVLFSIGAMVFFAVGRAMRLPRQTIGALTLVGGFGNTAFVGLPMIEALYGKDGLPLGLLIDQLGSYLALSTVGVTFASVYASQQNKSAQAICRQIITFPPFVAMLLALALIPLQFPVPVDKVLSRLGDTAAPLALISVGMQLRVGALREHARALYLGLGYKLLICPGLAIAVLWLMHAKPGMAGHVVVIESAMPPMIGAGVVASQAKLDPGLVSLIIGIGIPIAFSTTPAWTWLYGLVAG